MKFEGPLFYKMRNDPWGDSSKGSAWASGYGPLPSMPYFGRLPLFLESKKGFWDVNPMEPGLHIDPDGKWWPDFLGCGNSPPVFFVSDMVIDDLEANGVPIWRKTEFPIASIESKALQKKKPPRYFAVEVENGINIDFPASGIAVDDDGIPQFTKEQRLNRPILKLDHTSWSGTDLFSYSNLGNGNRLTVLCTEKVKVLAEKEGWTSIKFERQAIAGADPWTGKLLSS